MILVIVIIHVEALLELHLMSNEHKHVVKVEVSGPQFVHHGISSKSKLLHLLELDS